jgi:ribose transport system permease protein
VKRPSASWQDVGGFVVLLALAAVMTLVQPRFARPGNLLVILTQAGPLAVAAFGEAIVLAAGEIDLSTGSLAALVSIVTVMAARALGAPLGWLAGVVAGGLLGAVNGFVVSAWGIPSFIATVGMLTYADGMALLLSGGVPVEFPPQPFAWLGQGRLGVLPVPAVLAAAVGLAVHLAMARTVFGRRVYATGGNARAAMLSGVPVRRVRFLALTASGALAGLAAVVMSARVVSGQPSLDSNLPFEAIAALAVGGFPLKGGGGNVLQAAAGVLTFTALANGLNLANMSTYVQQMSIGAITILAILLLQWPWLQSLFRQRRGERA